MHIHAENVAFVLVEPLYPGNIGSACRAIKTMGFRKLVLVNPCDHLVPEARWMAHASEDILEEAQICQSLEEALADKHLVIATTQRGRVFHLPYFTPAELGERVVEASREHQIAVVFGREKSGLSNDELRQCHLVSTIPAALSHPSLNLAQAVMLYAYEFHKAAFAEEKRYKWRLANQVEMDSVYQHLQQTLERVEFVPQDNWNHFIMRFRRMFARATPEVRDVQLMHKIFQAVDQYLEHGSGKPKRKRNEHSSKDSK